MLILRNQGSLILLKAEAPEALEVLFPLICGIGMGVMLHAPYQIFVENAQVTRASDGHECVLPGPLHRSNSWTRKYYLAFLELILILFAKAVAGSIFYARASSRLPSDLPIEIQGSSLDFSGLSSIEPMSLRWEVLNIVATSVQVRHLLDKNLLSDGLQSIWVVCTPCLGLAFLVRLCPSLI